MEGKNGNEQFYVFIWLKQEIPSHQFSKNNLKIDDPAIWKH